MQRFGGDSISINGQMIGIGPTEFVHVLDLSTNITHLETGPQRLVLQSNEKLLAGPLSCIILPPAGYCTVKNPVKKLEEGKQCEVEHGHFDVRFHQAPFPLYPGEILVNAEEYISKGGSYSKAVRPLPVVKSNHAIRLQVLLDHQDGDVQRTAGDCFQLIGPLTYYPNPNVEILGIIKPFIVKEGHALKMRAVQDFTDDNGKNRVTDEMWLVRTPGAYLPGVYEEYLEEVKAYILNDNLGLHMVAEQTCVDGLGRERKSGQTWLITKNDIEAYIPEIGEVVADIVTKKVLAKGEYCVIHDPVNSTGRPRLGQKELRKGVTSFFLNPNERIPEGIQKEFVLSEDEAIVLLAIEDFIDDAVHGKPSRKAGDRWMIKGPASYIPPIQVHVMEQDDRGFVRKAISLAENEGIYIRHLQTGKIRAVMGPQSYLLEEYEELWEKKLLPLVEEILKNGGGCGADDIRKMAYFEASIDPQYVSKKGRDKTRVVTYRCPGNTAVQVYKYKEKTGRVVFGPDMAILGPHEDFNILSLSAGKPKRENALQTICLMLGPDYITDIIEVETSDHARLRIKIACNNHFEVKKGDKKSEQAIFSVPDFIGFACREIGGRIRGAVSRIRFDEFHKFSVKIIRAAVFGVDDNGKVLDRLYFEANQLVITNVDVQSIEPVDKHMRDSLMKSVQMAIEIATRSVEASAEHEASRMEQKAKGELERQKLSNEKEAEKARCQLYSLQAVTAAIESSGQAKAEASAQSEKLRIECQSEIVAAQLKAQADEILHASDLDTTTILRDLELATVRDQNNLETNKAQRLTSIEVSKFKKIVNTLGADTISGIAVAGPEMQVKLLKALGLETTFITDGNNPINLLNTAHGLIGTK
ncbi:major vault protein-like [Antedon mediterranea]|uniref:major vault protein-like n=1 Tax=Antedon mediterranea TaxID=105859 RepID=UPI003AF51B35